MTEHSDFDHVTGKTTTGHEWDGIRELNTPLPRWWVLTFYACIVWAIGYWIVYPAWPMLWSHTTGVLNYSSRADVAVELANLEKIRGDKMVALGAASLADIEKDPALLALARARGKTVFGDNCAPCHGVPQSERRRMDLGRHARPDPADHPVRGAFGTCQGSRRRDAGLRQGGRPEAGSDRHGRQLRPIAVGAVDQPRI
jgi:hypothetical protein